MSCKWLFTDKVFAGFCMLRLEVLWTLLLHALHCEPGSPGCSCRFLEDMSGEAWTFLLYALHCGPGSPAAAGFCMTWLGVLWTLLLYANALWAGISWLQLQVFAWHDWGYCEPSFWDRISCSCRTTHQYKLTSPLLDSTAVELMNCRHYCNTHWAWLLQYSLGLTDAILIGPHPGAQQHSIIAAP